MPAASTLAIAEYGNGLIVLKIAFWMNRSAAAENR
jgi:hypothetical protein